MKITRDTVEQVKHIDFIAFLERVEGFHFKSVGKYYVCQQHDSLNLIKGRDGFIYYTWNALNQHGDIIEYVQYNILGRRDFRAAVTYLVDFIGIIPTSENEKTHKPLKATGQSNAGINIIYSSDMKHTFAYLCKSRGILYTTIAYFVKNGHIAQDIKNNIVFHHRNFDGMIVGAELKGTNTYKKFSGTLKHSDEAYGFCCSIGHPKTLYVFEAEIDLLSYFDMYKQTLNDCILLSTSGCHKYMKIATYVERFNIDKIIFCMDNDEAANQTLVQVKDKFKHYKIIDGRTALVKHNVKDFNELLLII